MSRRRIPLVLLCEDRQHEACARRFFEAAGWRPRDLRPLRSPRGRGAGEQWVRERFPVELENLRRRHAATALVVLVDADRSSVEERLASFEAACRGAGVEARKGGEPVARFIPRRNVETWLAYLAGTEVDETSAYPKLERQRDCGEGMKRLKQMCDAEKLRPSSPGSLEAACIEYQTRLKPFRSG